MGNSLHGRMREDGHALYRLRSVPVTVPGRMALVETVPGSWRRRAAASVTLTEDVESRHKGCGRHLHRRLGFDGRAGCGMDGAYRRR